MMTALTIGASDCSGGAGVQADLKVFTVLGVYGMGVVTSVIARNTQGIAAVEWVKAEMVAAQMAAIAEDLPVGAVKTGYLGSVQMIDRVAEEIRGHQWNHVVVDPAVHTREARDVDASSVHAYRKELLPLASVVTPNRTEAALLANMDVGEVGVVAGAKKAAEKIVRSGARAVVIKGIATGSTVTDLFFDGDEFIEFAAKRATTRNTYGSGSLFSAIIAAMLAQEIELRMAVDHARSFASQAIEHHVKIGGGMRAVNVLALTPQ